MKIQLRIAPLVAALACGLALPALAAAQTPPPIAAAPPRMAPVEIRTPDLLADYFAADASGPAMGSVIVLGGSEGGFRGSRDLARRLSMEGFDAIAVSYFGEAGQSLLLDQIPIETVTRAREWLEARPGHRGRVAVMGVSKGAELALLTASRDPRIAAVAVGVPTHVVWQGIDQAGGPTGSSWTSGGQPLEYVRYDLSQGFSSIFKLYVDSLPSATPETEIPVERIAGPVLMISGGLDTLWPSADMANRIEARLLERGFAYPVVNLVYPEAGHAVFGPPIPRDAPGLERAVFTGGTVEALVAARADGWPRLVAFLRDALAR